jgi:hypothetical protein
MSHRAGVGVILALVAGSGQSMQAQPAAVTVNVLSVVPGTPAGVNDWCVGDEGDQRVVITAQVVASGVEVTQGTVAWQVCEGHAGGLPKEECQRGGSGHWKTSQISELSFDHSTPSLDTPFRLPILGFRLQFSPVARSGLKRAIGEPFNLDRTCSP